MAIILMFKSRIGSNYERNSIQDQEAIVGAFKDNCFTKVKKSNWIELTLDCVRLV